MRTSVPWPIDVLGLSTPFSARELFRARFQRALRSCVRRRFSVPECFGVIWLETLEEVELTDAEQADLYEELIRWAKHRLFPEVVESFSLKKEGQTRDRSFSGPGITR